MSTWKKVALAEDIGVFAGGTNTATLGGTVNDILLVGASGDVSYLTPGTNTIVVGDGGVATNFTFAGSADGADVTATFDGTANDITLTLVGNSVDTAELAADSVTLAQIDHASFDSTSDMTGALLYWDSSDNPDILEAGTNGQVLTLASGVPTWGDAGSATNVTINNGGAATDANFGILFGAEAALGGLDADKAYIDGATDSYLLSYNPSINGVTQPSFTSGKYTSDVAGDNDKAALYSSGGFAGDLVGTASAAKGVETTAVTTGTYYAPLLYTSTASTHGAQVGVNSGVSYTVNGAGDVDMTISGDLIINGNTTKLEVEAQEVQIADFRMLLAHTDADSSANGTPNLNGDQIQTAAGALGVGMLIDNAAVATETNLARFTYRGNKGNANFTNSKSVLGWVMAQEQNSAASAPATEVGVAAMHLDDGYTMTTAGGSSNKNFAKGAMAWFGTGTNGGLWIQTA
jgi:hypothetical protein